MFKKLIFILLIVIISGLSGILAEHYLFPYLAATKLFSKYEFLKKTAENVTVINKTEQVYIKEDSSINKIANQAVPAIVNIISEDVLGKKTKNGTGQIITSDGIILTYLSAINPESKVYKVMMNDGQIYDGALFGVDKWSNLAFIKINASNLPVISFTDDEHHEPGEKIIAIGNNAQVYQNNFSSGVLNRYDPLFSVSGKTLSMPEKLEGVYFCDFNFEALSPGSPVIDYSGKAIGVSGNVTADGKNVFFAIPAEKVKRAIEKAVKKELDSSPVMGIYYRLITKTLSAFGEINVQEGAIIYSPSNQPGLAILAGSPASRAGLKLNDIITHVDGEKINLANTLSDIFYGKKRGDRIELSIIRSGEEMKVGLEL